MRITSEIDHKKKHYFMSSSSFLVSIHYFLITTQYTHIQSTCKPGFVNEVGPEARAEAWN